MPDPRGVELPSTQGNAAPYFANYVADQLVRKYGPRTAFGGGLRVRTTLDVGLQQIARKAIISTLPSFATGDGPTAALVALDAHTGEVLAMVGGPNYHKSQFNLATQGQRQPGSSFKPFVLAAALEQHIAPSSVLDVEADHDRRRRAALAGAGTTRATTSARSTSPRRSPSPTTRSSRS